VRRERERESESHNRGNERKNNCYIYIIHARFQLSVGSVWNYVQFSDNFHVLHLLYVDVQRINKMLEGFIRCNREAAKRNKIGGASKNAR
jgi:hypothetical protein